MNLANTLLLSSDSMGPGAVGTTTSNGAVITPGMKKMNDLTQVAADASPSDLASHHVWQESSATDTTIKNWRIQRGVEKQKGRAMDPIEAQSVFLINKLGYL